MSSQHSTHEAFDAVAQALTVGEAAYLKSGLGQDFSVFNKAHAMLAGIEEQLEASQKALADAVDVAIWLTGLPCLNPESEAWSYWESGARPKLYKAMELLDSNPASEPKP